MTPEQELASSCMVCQEAKTVILKDGKDFVQHTEHEHDFWKYSDYLAYLTSKSTVDQSGFENIIWENYSKKLVNWIPSKDDDPSKISPEEEEALQKKKAEEEAAFKNDVNTKLTAISSSLKEVLEAIAKKNEPLPADPVA